MLAERFTSALLDLPSPLTWGAVSSSRLINDILIPLEARRKASQSILLAERMSSLRSEQLDVTLLRQVKLTSRAMLAFIQIRDPEWYEQLILFKRDVASDALESVNLVVTAMNVIGFARRTKMLSQTAEGLGGFDSLLTDLNGGVVTAEFREQFRAAVAELPDDLSFTADNWNALAGSRFVRDFLVPLEARCQRADAESDEPESGGKERGLE